MIEVRDYNGMSIPEGTYAVDIEGNIYSLPRLIAAGKRGCRRTTLKK